MRTAIIIPLANEETNIENLIRKIILHTKKDDQIFLIVDLSSKDNTLEIYQNIQRSHPQVTTIFEPTIKNVVEAYLTGMKEAYNKGYTQILEIDGGGSHQPEEIPRFLCPTLQQFDFIGGSRFMKNGKYQGRLDRQIVSRTGNLIAHALLQGKMSDMTSGFELFRTKAIEKLLNHPIKSTGHYYQTEVRLLMGKLNWKEVPITYHATSPLPKGWIKKLLQTLKK